MEMRCELCGYFRLPFLHTCGGGAVVTWITLAMNTTCEKCGGKIARDFHMNQDRHSGTFVWYCEDCGEVVGTEDDVDENAIDRARGK